MKKFLSILFMCCLCSNNAIKLSCYAKVSNIVLKNSVEGSMLYNKSKKNRENFTGRAKKIILNTIYCGGITLSISALLLTIIKIVNGINLNSQVTSANLNYLDNNSTCINFIEGDITNYSMLSGEVRNWYNRHLKKITGILDDFKELKPEESAKMAVNLRNCFKKQARKLMKCRTCADYLEKMEPPLLYDDLAEKYGGDYAQIIKKSSSSRKSVNRFAKISDFFEFYMPHVYEYILFPAAMYFSKKS